MRTASIAKGGGTHLRARRKATAARDHETSAEDDLGASTPEAGVMKKRVIRTWIDPVFVPLACEVPRPFSLRLYRVKVFLHQARPVLWKRLPELLYHSVCGGDHPATLKIRPVNPLFAWSCSKRLTTKDSFTSCCIEVVSRFTFKHSPATKPRGRHHLFCRCRRAEEPGRLELTLRPTIQACVRTKLSVHGNHRQQFAPFLRCSSETRSHPIALRGGLGSLVRRLHARGYRET